MVVVSAATCLGIACPGDVSVGSRIRRHPPHPPYASALPEPSSVSGMRPHVVGSCGSTVVICRSRRNWLLHLRSSIPQFARAFPWQEVASYGRGGVSGPMLARMRTKSDSMLWTSPALARRPSRGRRCRLLSGGLKRPRNCTRSFESTFGRHQLSIRRRSVGGLARGKQRGAPCWEGHRAGGLECGRRVGPPCGGDFHHSTVPWRLHKEVNRGKVKGKMYVSNNRVSCLLT